ncbi:hypothetical protein MTO96_045435 [Rhipicephalus appendiculatus]
MATDYSEAFELDEALPVYWDPRYMAYFYRGMMPSPTGEQALEAVYAQTNVEVFPALVPVAVPPIFVGRDAEGNRIRPGRPSDGKRVRWLFWQQRQGNKDDWDVPCSVRTLSFAAIALGILTVFVIVALWVGVRNQKDASETTSPERENRDY